MLTPGASNAARRLDRLICCRVVFYFNILLFQVDILPCWALGMLALFTWISTTVTFLRSAIPNLSHRSSAESPDSTRRKVVWVCGRFSSFVLVYQRAYLLRLICGFCLAVVQLSGYCNFVSSSLMRWRVSEIIELEDKGFH